MSVLIVKSGDDQGAQCLLRGLMRQIERGLNAANTSVCLLQDRYIQALFAAEIVIDHSFTAFRPRRDRIDARPTEHFVGKLTRCHSNDIPAVSFRSIGPPRPPFSALT